MKIQLTVTINSISSKDDNYTERVMNSITKNDEADEVKKNPFKSLKKRYQNNLEKMEGSEFAFHCVHLLHYK